MMVIVECIESYRPVGSGGGGERERDRILSTSLQNLWITAKFVFSLIKGCARPPSASALYKHDERQLKWKKKEKRDGDKTPGSPFISGTGECDRILLRKKKRFKKKKKRVRKR